MIMFTSVFDGQVVVSLPYTVCPPAGGWEESRASDECHNNGILSSPWDTHTQGENKPSHFYPSNPNLWINTPQFETECDLFQTITSWSFFKYYTSVFSRQMNIFICAAVSGSEHESVCNVAIV